jgi:hypothetical protein
MCGAVEKHNMQGRKTSRGEKGAKAAAIYQLKNVSAFLYGPRAMLFSHQAYKNVPCSIEARAHWVVCKFTEL